MQRESKNRSEQKRLFFLLKLPAIRFLLLFLHFVIFRLEMRTEPTTYNLLNTITFPKDLRQLSVEELPEVCKELRQDIIKEVSCNPGHFAASLGTVELTVALHYVFNTPYDRIVWDVGHQAYGHKILTGRREAFSTNRKFKGVRPFPSPEESDYDTFTCGHASNSISAALGMAVAAAEKGEKDRHVVAVIGDGSMSGGLAFEGLNNASSTPNNLLIILNDNDMSIDRSVGGMKQYLFNLTTSNRTSNLPPLFQDVFGETLVELAKENPKIVGVTPAMPTGCSMNKLMDTMPDRAFDVGIAEGHAATFSGGMAKEGMQPFCNIYSSFMQRAYDNVIHDIALLRLPVVLCLDRAGLVGEDGPTHHGVFDLAYFRPIPNLTISSPMDEHELRRLMYTAQLPDQGPFVIRYPRGRGVLLDWKCPLEEIPVGKGRRLKEGKDLAVITLGPIGNVAARAIERAEKDKGISIAHYDLRFLKPLDEALLHEVGLNFQHVVTIEDGVKKGGMGSAILEFMADNDYIPHFRRIGVPDAFIEHGTIQELHHLCGMDEEGIYNQLIIDS